MSASAERQKEEAAPPGPDAAGRRAEARGRTSSLPAALPLPPVTVAPGHSPWSPETARDWLRARLEAARGRELDLIHGPPPTLSAMHQRHQVAASHWQAALPRGIRLAWGLLHTAVAAILYAALDAAFSPAGALLAVLFLLSLIRWL